jgi:hypothetical protein
MKEMTNAYKILVEAPKTKITVRRHGHVYDNKIEMDFRYGLKMCAFFCVMIGTSGAPFFIECKKSR